ncbi:MAG: hypothetical protein ACTHMM_10235 [Agriterribacter sp.]
MKRISIAYVSNAAYGNNGPHERYTIIKLFMNVFYPVPDWEKDCRYW